MSLRKVNGGTHSIEAIAFDQAKHTGAGSSNCKWKG